MLQFPIHYVFFTITHCPAQLVIRILHKQLFQCFPVPDDVTIWPVFSRNHITLGICFQHPASHTISDRIPFPKKLSSIFTLPLVFPSFCLCPLIFSLRLRHRHRHCVTKSALVGSTIVHTFYFLPPFFHALYCMGANTFTNIASKSTSRRKVITIFHFSFGFFPSVDYVLPQLYLTYKSSPSTVEPQHPLYVIHTTPPQSARKDAFPSGFPPP